MKGRRKEKLTQLGPYRLTGELGRGAMGVVYRAVNEKLDREVALKVIAPERDLTPEALGRFQREAKAAAALSDHPGIVGCHDIGESDGRVYFAMDLCEGPSLEHLLEKDRLTIDQTLQIMSEAARAVHYAHEHRILHRDLKPGNILTTKDGEARVADFGLAKTQTADAESMKLTKSGALIGTPAYMAPEQSFGDRIDERADVYSLGATLYHALTGETPFPTDSLYSLLAKIQKTDAEPVRRLNSDVPTDVETIVAKCLEKDPGRRYQSAAELADDLDRARVGDSIMAKPPGMVSLIVRKAKRRKGVVIASSLGVVGAIVLAAVLVPQITSAETAAESARREAKEAAAEAKRKEKEAAAALKRAKRSGRKIREAELAASKAAREARAARERAAGAGAAAQMDLEEARRAAQDALDRLAAAEEREREASDAAAKVREELAALKRRMAARAGSGTGSDDTPAVKTPWGYLRGSAETALTAMLEVRRAGVPGRMQQFLALVQQAARDAEAMDPESGEPQLWLARAHRANFDDVAALDALDQAVLKQGDLLAARWERLFIGMRRSVEAQQRGDDAAVERIRALTAEDFRTLENAGALQGAKLGLGRGLAALAARKPQQAQTELARVLQASGADVFAVNEAMARTLGLLDRPGDAAIYWTKVVEADAGYLPARRARAFFTLTAARPRFAESGEQLAQVIADYDLVLQAMPQDVDAKIGRAQARHLLASSQAVDESIAPDVWGPLFEASVADWDALEGKTPPGFPFFRNRAIVLLDHAVFLGRGNRGDPAELFASAVSNFERDVELSPENIDALIFRANANTEWANYERVHHQGDPKAHLDAAVADWEKVLKLNPKHLGARSRIADSLVLRATFARKYQEDPAPLLREATKAFKALTRQAPKDINAWHGLAGAWLWRAREQEREKRASAKEHKEAIDAWERVIRINPQDLRALIETGKSWYKIGEQLQEKGKDARTAFTASCASFEKSLAIAPERNADWIWIGRARRRLAWALGPKAKGADGVYQRAYDEINTALDREPGNHGFWRERGEVSFLWARSLELRREKQAGARWKACFDDFSKAVALGLNDPDITKKLKVVEAGMAKHGVKR